MLDKIHENERHRQAIEEAREQNKRLMQARSDTENYEKMMAIKNKTQQLVEEKANNTLKTLQIKDEIAKQELEKVREAQDRRKMIKALRQEAYTINSIREKKKEEYRLAKIQKQLQDKEERLSAIRKGFTVLSSMRNSMKDIMEKTNYEIKTEMERLKHSSSFSPNRVVEKAMEVSKEVLFPRLGRTFGFVNEDLGGDAPKLFDPQSDHFSFDLGDRPATAPLGEEGGSRGASRGKTRGRSPAKQGRGPAPTLKIQTLQEDKLRTALFDSMRRVEAMNNGLMSRSASPHKNTASHSHSPLGERREFGEGGEGEDGDQVAILQLPKDEHNLSSEAANRPHSSSNSPATKRAHSREKGAGRYVGKSALAKSAGDDTQIPIFAFTAGSEFKDADQPKEKEVEPAKSPNSHKKSSVSKLRNDVNEKAKFLPLPTGKFRREFSADHPLARGGKGKYKQELNKGMTPQGLPLEIPKKDTKSVEENVAEAVALSDKIEKLTYEAQSSVVDDVEDIDKL
eukprot:gene42483-51898_t